MGNTDAIAKAVYEILHNDIAGRYGRSRIYIKTQKAWSKLREIGTRLWLDTSDIEMAKELWSSEFEALTTNNTLLNKEVQKGIYDD